MLYMVISKHSPESCPGRPGNEGIHPCVNMMEDKIKEKNIRIVGRWADPAAHVNYMVLDAESGHAIQEALLESDLFAYTTTEIRLVWSMDEEYSCNPVGPRG